MRFNGESVRLFCPDGLHDTYRLSPSADAFSRLLSARNSHELPAYYVYSLGGFACLYSTAHPIGLNCSLQFVRGNYHLGRTGMLEGLTSGLVCRTTLRRSAWIVNAPLPL